MKRDELRNWSRKQVLTIKDLWKDKASIIIGVSLGIALFFGISYIKGIAVMAALAAIGAVSLLYNRAIRVSLGIELVMMGTVITGLLYGTIPAAVVGVVSLFFAFLFTAHFTHATFVSFIAIIAVSFLVPVFSGMGITWAGIILTVIYDAIIAAGYLFLGSRVERTILFIATHIAFNVWVFTSVAPRIYGLLA
ncbi:hypothetical protein JXB11_01325 [Candidatus Woesearchaeota archaeon]|nr:hypothetical protein [Candidatus Woesearchaeota archaeon]